LPAVVSTDAVNKALVENACIATEDFVPFKSRPLSSTVYQSLPQHVSGSS